MKKVSIGLPTYNRPELLKRAIESLRQQTYTNWELIVSDDCHPTANNKAVCDEFITKGLRIKYHRPEKNLGPALNHKRVLDLADGDFFFWASDDDLWHPDFIKSGVENLANDNGVDCYMCSFVNVDSFGRTTRVYPSMKRFSSTKYKFLDIIKYMLEPESLGKAVIFHGLFKTLSIKSVSDHYFVTDNDPGTDNPFILSYILRFNIIASENVYLHKTILNQEDNIEIKPIITEVMYNSRETFLLRRSLSLLPEYYRASRGTPYVSIVVALIIFRILIAVKNKILNRLYN